LIDSPQIHRKASEVYADANYTPSNLPVEFAKKAIGQPIRIGYYSADFQNHATAYLIAGLFESHSSEKFKLYGFSFGPQTQDDMRQRVSAAFDQFIDIGQLCDREVAALSRDLGIDIAIDLKGYTAHSRPGIFAAKCAPIQVNYLGYPGTLGASYFDYTIADTTVISEQTTSSYSEKIVYLPHCYQVNDSKRQISERSFMHKELGLPESGFVFCCFNSSYKILPATFDCWMRILKAAEGSVLWLLEDTPTVVRNLRNEAQARGISGDRLVFAKRMPLADHLARHRCAHLFLDTLPCNAHTTASDALWAGLPVLTLPGEAFQARVAASLLHAVGLSELVMHSRQEYETTAIDIALDKKRHESIKTKLLANLATSPLFNTRLFVQHIESAFESMQARYLAGMAPDHIWVQK
jgi:predicted O-linked N-acetylglucosamine transferase (SPINDLY family)